MRRYGREIRDLKQQMASGQGDPARQQRRMDFLQGQQANQAARNMTNPGQQWATPGGQGPQGPAVPQQSDSASTLNDKVGRTTYPDMSGIPGNLSDSEWAQKIANSGGQTMWGQQSFRSGDRPQPGMNAADPGFIRGGPENDPTFGQNQNGLGVRNPNPQGPFAGYTPNSFRDPVRRGYGGSPYAIPDGRVQQGPNQVPGGMPQGWAPGQQMGPQQQQLPMNPMPRPTMPQQGQPLSPAPQWAANYKPMPRPTPSQGILTKPPRVGGAIRPDDRGGNFRR